MSNIVHIGKYCSIFISLFFRKIFLNASLRSVTVRVNPFTFKIIFCKPCILYFSTIKKHRTRIQGI